MMPDNSWNQPRTAQVRCCRLVVTYNDLREVRQTYCWRAGDGPMLGESLWSIVHKFCSRNALNGSDISAWTPVASGLPTRTATDVARRVDERVFADACFGTFKQFRGHYGRVGKGGRSPWVCLRASPLAAPFFLLEPIGSSGLRLHRFETTDAAPVWAHPTELS